LSIVSSFHSLQYLGDLGCEYVVYKNDEKTAEEIRAMNPRGILVSPGPGKKKRVQQDPSQLSVNLNTVQLAQNGC
jgi:anthranilate/para-aminobenzoate synthase component II